MSGRTARWFWTVVAAQAVFLLAWAGWHERIRTQAAVIVLRTKPVDPRDLLRGDYLQLRYEIADVAPAEVKALPLNSDAWVTLEPHGRVYDAVAVSATEPEVTGRRIAVRARRSWSGLTFGIERFFVPEGKGTPRFKTMEVEAVVGPARRLYIKRILLDGRSYP